MTFLVRPWVIGSPTTLLIPYRDAWPYCQLAIRRAVGDDAYTTWFGSVKCSGIDKQGRVLRLTVASSFLRRWIRCHYQDLVLAACQSEWPTLVGIEVSVRSCVLRDMRSKLPLLLPAPPPPPPRKSYARYMPWELFPGHPDVSMPAASEGLVKNIQRVVSRQYNVSRTDLLSARRTANVVRPRQVAMYLAKSLTLRSLPDIGRRFGGRDHTTVLHAVRKIESLIQKDIQFAEEVESLKRQLQS